jgi:RNA polymerase sigma-70 factor, ECF subfamily
VESAEGVDAQDRRLIDGVRRGEESAFRGLFGRYAATAKALALRVVRQPHLAEEIVQEAFLTLWRQPEGYDPSRGSVRAWLLGMVHHRAVDLVRREESQRRRSADMGAGLREEADDPAQDVAAALDRPAERERVREALAALPDEQREVLTLMYFDGLTQTEVAARSGLPLGTVKSRCLLGMRRMRAAMQGWER